MEINILTPDEEVFQGSIIQAKFPGSDGAFEVLPNHAALISTLGSGKMSIRTTDSENMEFMIEGGVVEILNNHISVLVEVLVPKEA